MKDDKILLHLSLLLTGFHSNSFVGMLMVIEMKNQMDLQI